MWTRVLSFQEEGEDKAIIIEGKVTQPGPVILVKKDVSFSCYLLQFLVSLIQWSSELVIGWDPRWGLL